jgi:hypothetical protein
VWGFLHGDFHAGSQGCFALDAIRADLICFQRPETLDKLRAAGAGEASRPVSRCRRLEDSGCGLLRVRM